MIINGVEYKERELVKPSKSMAKLLGIAAIFGGLKISNSNIEGIDVVEEFKLIQEKKSSLSRSLRDSVVYQFYKYYEKV